MRAVPPTQVRAWAAATLANLVLRSSNNQAEAVRAGGLEALAGHLNTDTSAASDEGQMSGDGVDGAHTGMRRGRCGYWVVWRRCSWTSPSTTAILGSSSTRSARARCGADLAPYTHSVTHPPYISSPSTNALLTPFLRPSYQVAVLVAANNFHAL
eukprot:546828-Prorocentrum_minimum.AAC.1